MRIHCGAAVSLMAVLVVAGCGSSGKPSATPAPPSPAATTTPSPARITAAPAATSGSAASQAAGSQPGCAAGGGGTPAGATTKPIIDIDGDGKPDTGWATADGNATFTFGFTTASGASSRVKFQIAGGEAPYEFFMNVDGKGTIGVLVANNRGGGLYVLDKCKLVPAVNPQGQDYDIGFDAGEGGNGLGCSTVAGATGQTLVGLAPSGPEGKPTGVTRTQIIIAGTKAHNGLMDTVRLTGGAAAAEKAAMAVSCGNLTVVKDAVTPATPN